MTRSTITENMTDTTRITLKNLDNLDIVKYFVSSPRKKLLVYLTINLCFSTLYFYYPLKKYKSAIL